MKLNVKSEKGVSLVAITIGLIVLVVLIGVSVYMLMDGGLFDKVEAEQMENAITTTVESSTSQVTNYSNDIDDIEDEEGDDAEYVTYSDEVEIVTSLFDEDGTPDPDFGKNVTKTQFADLTRLNEAGAYNEETVNEILDSLSAKKVSDDEYKTDEAVIKIRRDDNGNINCVTITSNVNENRSIVFEVKEDEETGNKLSTIRS